MNTWTGTIHPSIFILKLPISNGVPIIFNLLLSLQLGLLKNIFFRKTLVKRDVLQTVGIQLGQTYKIVTDDFGNNFKSGGN